MNKLIYLLFIFSIFSLNGQENTFYRKYNMTGMQGGLCMIETSDGGFIATGQHEGNGSFGDCDTYVYRIDECGNLKWMYLYGTQNQEGAKNIEELANGDYLIAGLADFGQSGFLLRISYDGEMIWSKKFPAWMSTATAENQDGTILVTGITNSWGTLVLKINASGETIWSKNIENFGNYGMFIKNLINGDFVLTSVAESSSDFFAARLDPAGNIIWSNSYGLGWYNSDHTAFSNKGLLDELNNALLVTSPIIDNSGLNEDILVAKLDLGNGNIIWAKQIGGSELDQSRDMVKTESGYALLGHTSSYNSPINSTIQIDAPMTNKNILLFTFDENGNSIWSRIYGAEGDDKGISLQSTAQKGFLISAYTSSPFFGNADFSFDPLFIRTDETGKIGCQSTEIDLVSSFINLTVAPSGVMQNNDIITENYYLDRVNYTPIDDYICQECISIPEFTVNELNACINEEFHFENTTSIGLKCFQQWVIDGQTFNGDENISYSFDAPGIYPIQLLSSCGNENNSYSLNVIVQGPCNEENVENVDSLANQSEEFFYVPNTFTPNGDESNQYFNIVFAYPELISDFDLTIFNRWGEEIFSANNPFAKWDGTYQDKLAMQGVYSWKASFKYSNAYYSEFGRITLIR